MTSLRDSTADAAAALMTEPSDGSVTLSADIAAEVRAAIKGARSSLEKVEAVARSRDDKRALRVQIIDLNSALMHLGFGRD